MVADTSDVGTWSVSLLEKKCADESKKFAAGLNSDTRYGYELFRRALQAGDDEAWAAIERLYKHMVMSWIHRHPGFANMNEDVEALVNTAFANLWRAFVVIDERTRHTTRKKGKFDQFPTLASILGYFQQCARSAVTHMAKKQPPIEKSIDDVLLYTDGSNGTTSSRIDSADREAFWDVVRSCLHNDQDVLVMRESFELGFAPRQVYARHPDLFRDVHEINDIKQNVRGRLRRCPQLKDFLEE